MSEQTVNAGTNFEFGQAVEALFTANYESIRKVIHHSETRKLLQSWHNYAALAQDHEKEWAMGLKFKPELTIIGVLCLESAKKAVAGIPFPALWSALENRVIDPPAKHLKRMAA